MVRVRQWEIVIIQRSLKSFIPKTETVSRGPRRHAVNLFQPAGHVFLTIVSVEVILLLDYRGLPHDYKDFV